MKKSNILIGLSSILMCFTVFCFIFSLSIFTQPETAGINVQGVTGKFKKMGENIIDFITPETENQKTRINNGTLVYIGGYPIGLKLYADGVIVVGTEAIDTDRGNINAAENAGFKIGDLIKTVNGKTVNSNLFVSEIIAESAGEELSFGVMRNGEYLNINFKGEYSVSENKYKAGLWIRDSSAGIGTVTFCTQDGLFAALGHAVCDIDTKETLPISRGECTDAKITGYIKGKVGTAGELCGYLETKKTGVIYSNRSIGVYGAFDDIPENCELYPIALPEEVETGHATIITTLENGEKETYNIKIEKIHHDDENAKHLVIKVTDNTLLDKTGGIIQGMSGSPILQNGKLVGAITHVLVDDPTRGYGIFAQTMLEECLSAENIQDRAS